MIDFSGVRVRYPRQTRDALTNVSVRAARGAITAVVGPNGSGKSTMVRALLGRVPLVEGSIAVDGHDARLVTRGDFARRVAVVTQREETAFPIAVKEYVSLGRLPHRGTWGRDTAEDRAAVEEAMRRAEVDVLQDRSVHQLSGGEWQRVRFARALAQGGDAFVADEPTTFLDVAHEMIVFELLERIAREGRAVLLVSCSAAWLAMELMSRWYERQRVVRPVAAVS